MAIFKDKILNNPYLLHPTTLLYESLQKPSVKGLEELEQPCQCNLCGKESFQLVSWKITSTFTDLDIFAYKENIKYLCPSCAFALDNLRNLHKMYLLTYSKGLEILQFDDQSAKKAGIGKIKIVSRYFLKDFLLNAPTDDPWILMLQSKMNPQHSLIRAKVNYGESDTLWVSDGQTPYAIPKEGLKELFDALEKVKRSDTLYPYLFKEGHPAKTNKEYHVWEEIEPIIYKHRYKHYLPFLYDRFIPPKAYLLEDKAKGDK